MQYSVYPISMSMFNQKLESCQTVQDVKANFKFVVTEDTPVTLSVFIKSTEYLIQSFEDLNFMNWGFFFKKIVQIFPGNPYNLELKRLENNILIKFKENFPKLAIAGKNVSEEKKPNEEIDAAFNQVSDVYTISLEKRIENAFYIEKATSAEKQARILQLSLNFLILEFDLINYTLPFLKDAFKVVEIQKELRLGCDRIIRITEDREITLFEIPINLEETEEFSSWLQLSPYLDLSFDGDRLFASMKHIHSNTIDLRSFTNLLRELHKNTSSNKIHLIIDKWLKSMEYEGHISELFESVKTLFVQFVKSVNQSSLVQCEYSREFEFEIAPISFYLFKLINDYAMFSIFEKPRDLPAKDLHNFKRVLDLWDIHKETQCKLFEEANRQLLILIKNNPRAKPLLYRYNRDLTGPAKGISENMRPYPNELQIFDPSEKGANLTDKPPIISSKTPKIKNVSPKNNTKKFSPKKTSKQQQIISQPKEILEIKDEFISILVKEKKEKTELNSAFSSKDEQKLNLPSLPVFSGENFLFKIDQRVQRWDDHPFGEPFFEKDFPEYYDKTLSYQKLMHLFHAPHQLVDRFLSYGIQGTWLNVQKNKSDLRYVIPAEITYDNKRYRGLIVYAIDTETKVCYHRFFTEKMDQDILYQVTNRVFNENDYPDLKVAVNIGQFPLPKLNIVDSSSIKIESGHVEIIDFDREVKIKLFKVKTS